MPTPPWWEEQGMTAEQADAEMYSFLNGGLAPGEHVPMQGDGFTPTDPNSAIGAALAAADQPGQASGGPVPDVVDQQGQAPVWTPPAEVPPTSLTQAPPLELRSVSSSQGGTFHTLPPPPQAGRGSGPTPPDPNWLLDQTVGHADDGNGATGVYRQAEAYGTERDAQLGIDATNEEAAVDEANLAANELTDANVEVARRNRNLKLAQQAQVDAELRIRDIDPAHVWSTKDGGQKAAALVSAFIGGFLSPYNGGKNGALDQISQMIDDDIRAQEQNQATARYMLGRADTALDKAERGVQLSREEKRMACAKDIAARLKQKQASYQSVFTQAKFQNNIGLLERYVGEQSAAIANKTYERLDSRDRFEKQFNLDRYKASSEAKHRSAMYQLAKDEAAAKRAASNAPPPPNVVLSATAPGNRYAVDPQVSANKTNSDRMLGEFHTAQQFAAKVQIVGKEFIDKSTAVGALYNGLASKTKWSDEDKPALNALRGYLIMTTTKGLTGAHASGKQEGYVDDMVGDIESWIKRGPRLALEQTMRNFGNEAKAQADALGLVRIDKDGQEVVGKDGKPMSWSLESEGYTLPLSTRDKLKAQTQADFTTDIASLGPESPVDTWDAASRLLEDDRTQAAVSDPGKAINYMNALFAAAGKAPTPEIKARFLNAAENVDARLRTMDLVRNAPDTPARQIDRAFSPRSGVPLFNRAQMSTDDILKNAASGDAWHGSMDYRRRNK